AAVHVSSECGDDASLEREPVVEGVGQSGVNTTETGGKRRRREMHELVTRSQVPAVPHIPSSSELRGRRCIRQRGRRNGRERGSRKRRGRRHQSRKQGNDGGAGSASRERRVSTPLTA